MKVWGGRMSWLSSVYASVPTSLSCSVPQMAYLCQQHLGAHLPSAPLSTSSNEKAVKISKVGRREWSEYSSPRLPPVWGFASGWLQCWPRSTGPLWQSVPHYTLSSGPGSIPSPCPFRSSGHDSTALLALGFLYILPILCKEFIYSILIKLPNWIICLLLSS